MDQISLRMGSPLTLMGLGRKGAQVGASGQIYRRAVQPSKTPGKFGAFRGVVHPRQPVRYGGWVRAMQVPQRNSRRAQFFQGTEIFGRENHRRRLGRLGSLVNKSVDFTVNLAVQPDKCELVSVSPTQRDVRRRKGRAARRERQRGRT